MYTHYMLVIIQTVLAQVQKPEFNAGEGFEAVRQNVPLIGLLWFICIGLIGAVIKLWSAYQSSNKDRLDEKKTHAEDIAKMIRENNERFDKYIKERQELEEEFRKEILNLRIKK